MSSAPTSLGKSRARPKAGLVAMRLAMAAVWLASGGLLSSCGGTIRAMGTTPEDSRRHASELLEALTWRLGPLEIEPSLLVLRTKLANGSFVPSRIYSDAPSWSRSEGDSRQVGFVGTPGETRYHVGIRGEPPRPSRPGDYRGQVRLDKVGPGDYAWDIHEELAIGGASGGDLQSAFAALLGLAESSPEGDARESIRSALPRTAQVLGLLFSLDAVELSRLPDGSMRVRIAMSLHPEGVKREYPRYSRYLERYLPGIRFAVSAYDAPDRTWWRVQMAQSRAEVLFRVQNSRLAPLTGAVAPMPSTFSIGIDYTTRVGLFRVGVRGLVGEGTVADEGYSFRASFRRDPEWALPFLVEPILRSSLRHPFEGEGSRYHLGIEDGGKLTLLTQDYSLAVHESWIVRWLGGLASGAVLEFEAGPEEEAGRYEVAVLRALRDDVLPNPAEHP